MEILDKFNLNDDSKISQFYLNKTIFLTGGTGFLGKVIIEKLLRSTDVQRIFLLIRSKKEKDINKRLNDLVDDPLFETLYKQKPDFVEKVSLISGDCTLPELGISKEDRELLKQSVEIVIHSAATVRFTEPIKFALAINVRGTKEIVKLSKEMLKLECLVYISTAFSNCNRSNIEEKYYKTKLSGDIACNLLENLDSDLLDYMTPKLLGQFPNTYTYTKSLAEDVIVKHCKGLPVIIFRPGIVLPTYEEPVHGWIDNYYGPTSILTGVAAGILRVIYVRMDAPAHIVPVDFCANAILASTWKKATTWEKLQSNEPAFYNFVPHEENSVEWGVYRTSIETHGVKMPLSRMLWYPVITSTTSKVLYTILKFLCHIVPGFLIDTYLRLSKRKPRLLKIYEKIHKGCDMLNFFVMNEWIFSSDNVSNLWNEMSFADKKLFNFNMKDLDWNECLLRNLIGLRLYLVKEDPSTIPRGKALHRKLKLIHYTFVGTIYGFVLYMLWCLLRMVF